MCVFFSPIVCRDGRILFCESDAHEDIIARAGLRDDDQHLRHWVRAECVPGPDGLFPDVRVDETSVPAWYADDRAAWDDKVRLLALRVAPALKVYEDTCAPAWKVYEDTCAPARKVDEDTCAAALKVYDATCDAALKVYGATCAPARTVYDATVAAAWTVYLNSIRTIEGYVP